MRRELDGIAQQVDEDLAQPAGITVDEVKLSRWGEWAAGKSLSMRGYFTLSDASLAQLRRDAGWSVLLREQDQQPPTRPCHFDESLRRAAAHSR